MELRKVQKTSDGTYFLTMPKRWIKRVSIDKGSLIYIRERENGTLSISPYSEAQREIEAVVLEPTFMMERLIGENYLLGADIIEIRSSKVLSSESRDKIKHIIKRFVGLEIVEENSKKIAIQCLLEPGMLMPEKVLRRIHLISLEMEKDAVYSLINVDSVLAETAIERDEEVDRLYFLLVRLVRAALTQPALVEKMSISPIECLDYRLLASLIEHFADYTTSIGDVTLKLKHEFKDEIKNIFKNVGDSIYILYRDAFTSFIKKDLLLADSVSKECKIIITELTRSEEHLIEMNKKTVEYITSVLISLNSMVGVCIDIADLTRSR